MTSSSNRAWHTIVVPRLTLVVFEATWCCPCQRAKPLVAQIEEAGIQVVHYDIDKYRQLAEQYQVVSVPTFLIMDRSGVIRRTNDIQEVLKVLGLS